MNKDKDFEPTPEQKKRFAKDTQMAIANGPAVFKHAMQLAEGTHETGLTICAAMAFFSLTSSVEGHSDEDLAEVYKNSLLALMTFYRKMVPEEIELVRGMVMALPSRDKKPKDAMSQLHDILKKKG
jgi:hypothetical protein